ncbi:UNVERIFIED_ORG: hypothetical protein J2W87_001413 [Pseudomonas putida]|nr:hypothetical protein [Pseudomonas putida]
MEKKSSRSYEGFWFLFTVFVIFPAFIMASNVEGLDFGEARYSIQCGLMEFFMPQSMSWVLSFPVTVMATVIPGTAALSTAFGNFIWSWVGPLLVGLFLLSIAPPFIEKFERDASVSTRRTQKTFTKGLILIIVFLVLAELYYAFYRDPLADTYTGDVYLVTVKDGRQVNTPLGAKLKLDVVETGYVYDRRPGVSGSGVRMEFSGENLDVLRKLGVPAPMINHDGRMIPFGDAYCRTSQVTHQAHADLFGGHQENYKGVEFDYAQAFNLKFQGETLNCGEVHLGVLNFDELQFAMDEINPKGYIFADLKRDSHISWFQRTIMALRFDRRTVQATFGGTRA